MTAPALVDGARLTLTGRITAVDVRINQQSNPQATVRLITGGGTVTVFVPPRLCLDHPQLLHDGRDVVLDVAVSVWRGVTTVMARHIRATGDLADYAAQQAGARPHPMYGGEIIPAA